jgi:hypothetical protein
MPIKFTVASDDDPKTLRVPDLKEGEVYRDDTGDWLLVLRNDPGDKEVITACHDGEPDKRGEPWFQYRFSYDERGTVFTGPYNAEIRITGLKAGSDS